MTFDAAQRRLITGSSDGRVCMWNFNSGSRLREFKHSFRGQEICAVLYVHDKIVHSHEVCPLPYQPSSAAQHMQALPQYGTSMIA